MKGNSGFFILIKDENKKQENLRLCLKNGFYGFLLNSNYDLDNTRTLKIPYSVLADYVCCKEGTHVFLFSKRMITYGGIVKETNGSEPVFYLNGKTPLIEGGGEIKRYINMDEIYKDNLTSKEGVYEISGRYGKQLKEIPFIIEFDNHTELTGKQISVDELYFELGKYNFPLPSNAIQGKGMCTLTPYETNLLLKLIKENGRNINPTDETDFKQPTYNQKNKTIFKNEFIIEKLNKKNWSVEAELEFLLLSTEKKLKEIIPKGNYAKTRQLPLCPFKPQKLDYADICLYDLDNQIKNGALPNIIIELKKDYANYEAYKQVNRYLKWLDQVTTDEEFNLINAFIISKEFKSMTYKKLKEKEISLKYQDKIQLYSLNENKFIKIKN